MNYEKLIYKELRQIRMNLSVIALALRKIVGFPEELSDDETEDDLAF